MWHRDYHLLKSVARRISDVLSEQPLLSVLLFLCMQGYGDRGLGEIPGGATLQIDVELLSIKTSPLGYRTKLIEG